MNNTKVTKYTFYSLESMYIVYKYTYMYVTVYDSVIIFRFQSKIDTKLCPLIFKICFLSPLYKLLILIPTDKPIICRLIIISFLKLLYTF